MRALRVVGVTGDGSVVLEDPGRRERYTVPADEQLRAAARGDVTRLGQIAIELESQLRPREIQARIRGGASVDEVAAAAGVPVQKIERFAYPVLLERSRTAELAQGAHPQRADGPDSRTLGETVAHTFGLRGQDYSSAGWDSWRGDDGKWVVALTWQTGRSDNAAHWAFQPGAHGGTVVALDEHASDLVEGLPARPLRPLGAVVDMARDDEPAPVADDSTEAPARAVAGGHAPPADPRAGRGIAPEQRRPTAPAARSVAPSWGAPRTDRDDARAPAASAPVTERPADDAPSVREPASTSRTERTSPADTADATAAQDGAAGSHPAAGAAGTPAPGAAGSGSAGTGAVETGAAGSGAEGSSPAESGPAEQDSVQAGTTGSSATGSSATASGTAAGSGAAGSGAAGSGTTGPGTTRSGAAESGDAEPGAGESDAGKPGTTGSGTTGSGTAGSGAAEPESRESGTGEAAAEDQKPRNGGTASRRTKKGKPVMPSWDEVLLGVRGQR